MTTRQIREFFEDNDASQIAVRKFNVRFEDTYPTYSLCIQSMYGAIYTENVKEIYGTRWQYTNVLRGESLPRNISENEFANILRIDHETFLLNVRKILPEFESRTKDGNKLIYYHTRAPTSEITEGLDMLFYVSYQDPTQVCYSRKHNDRKGDKSDQWDEIVQLAYTHFPHANLRIFLHHPHQLIRSINTPMYDVSFNNSIGNKNTMVILKIASVVLLKKRVDGKHRCDSSLKNDDLEFIRMVISNVRCIPNYWISLIKVKMPFNVCTKSAQL